MQIEIPQQVAWILARLREQGFEAYAVGGCVRDALLDRIPGDWDITTSAKPEEVKRIFGKTIDTGLKHGTVTVMRDHVGYEITTYRIDGEYEDGRHPKEVSFTGDLKEDLCRRDFTINAMAYSVETGIVDIFGGMEDLKSRVIRCVGIAEERFTEDALRLLRAIRFSAQLGFEIQKDTFLALSEIAPNLANVSKERIQTELTKTLLSDHPERIFITEETGMSSYLSPTFPIIMKEWKNLNLKKNDTQFCQKRMEQAGKLPFEKAVRWAAFLSPSEEEQAGKLLKEMKMDNDTIRQAKTLVRWIFQPLQTEPSALRNVMSQMSDPLFDSLLDLKSWIEPERAEEIQAVREAADVIRTRGDCIRMKDLAVTGNDLKKAGIPSGPLLGTYLKTLFDLVLKQPELNKKEELLEIISKKK